MNTKNSTWIVKRKENIVLIDLYKKFFFNKKLDFHDRDKLFEEIRKLEEENDWINGMTQSERRQDDLSYELIKESGIQLITNN